MKELESLFGRAPGPGALYPQLRYLRQKKLVSVNETERGAKKIKIYNITKEGLDFLNKNREELERILIHIQSAKTLLDMGLKRFGEDIAKTIDILPKINESDRKNIAEILDRASKDLEIILSKYSQR